MQTFKPECVVQICINSWGKPARFSYGILLSDAKERPLLEFSHYLGPSSTALTSMQATNLALEQALHFKFEKVELRVNSSFQVDFLKNPTRVPREETLKSYFVRVERLQKSFRFFRWLQVPQEQMQDAFRLAERARK